MTKICKTILFSLALTFWFINSYAETKIINVPEFNGGLKVDEINSCYAKMEKFCHKQSHSRNWMQYKKCIVPHMQHEKTCIQPLALLRVSNSIFAMFDKIHVYPQVDVVHALTIMADKSSTNYVIGKNGDFVNVDAFHPDLKFAKNYADFAVKYPNMEDFDVLYPPATEKLPNGGIRLIFKREINDMCRACPIIAFAEEAYDFAVDGKFLGAKVLQLVPVK